MMDKGDQAAYVDQPMIYHIRVKSHLGRQWTDRFEELRITLQEDGTTLLTGQVVDLSLIHI